MRDKLEAHVRKIAAKGLQAFTLKLIYNAPAYFWTLKASTSGRRHGESETLLEHVVGCLDIADSVCEQMEAAKAWGQSHKDRLRAALALHDCWRCGFPGMERRYPPDHELAGELRTSPDHPEAGFVCIMEAWHAEVGPKPDHDTICEVAEAVRLHYGPWTRNVGLRFDVQQRFDSVVMQVHNIDHMHAQMMRLGRKG